MPPHRIAPVATAAALALTLATVTTSRSAPAAADAWDADAAARYLDSRMDLWWTKAKALKTGTSETKCLSCHTAIPYALARPALRRVQGVSAPTSHEDNVLATLRLRVAHIDDQAPYYDHTDAKKIESRGVEAVTTAWLLTRHDTLGRSSQPSAPTRRAIERLWDVQRADGAWDWLDFGLEPYETTDAVYHGATLAAMAAGSTPGRAASADAKGKAGVERLRAYLRDNLATQRRFNQVWALMASAWMPEVMSPSERAAIVKDLVTAQRQDGGWALSDLGAWRWSKSAEPFGAPGKGVAATDASDAYATGLVVYALKLADRTAHRDAIARGQAWLRAQQVPERAGDAAWAPWRSHSLNFDREHGGDKGEPWRRMFMSDLATAFAVLALAG